MTEQQGLININMHKAERSAKDIETIHSILDNALVCHVGFIQDGIPYVIPHSFGRIEDELFMHGAIGGRMMNHIASGGQVCVEVTLLDSLVLARSMFMHSVNYRSVLVFGKGRLIESKDEKNRALKAISDQLIPGRWEECRQPNKKELDATKVIAIKMDVATAKINQGMPSDKKSDLDFPVWAGILPLYTLGGEPKSAEGIDPELKPLMNIKVFKKEGIG